MTNRLSNRAVRPLTAAAFVLGIVHGAGMEDVTDAFDAHACGEQQNCCCKRRTYRETLPDRVIRGFPRWSSHQRSFRQNALPLLSLEGLEGENITRRG